MDLDTARGLKQELWSFVDQVRLPARDRARRGSARRPAGLAIGLAPTGKRGQIHLAIRAESEADLPDPALAEIRRRTANEVDVRFTGPIHPVAARYVAPATRPLMAGSSIAHYRCSAGTLGFFARRSSDGAIGIVSNNHVIAATDQARDGDDVLQPAPADEGTRLRHVVARLSGDYPRLRQASAVIDCAFAPLVDGMQFDPAPAGQRLASDILPPHEDLQTVCKIGRTTGETYGRVTAFELDEVRVSYLFGKIRFTGQIEIDSSQGVAFSRPGDSGSLIFTVSDRRPLGLLFASSLRGGAANLGLTYANPLHSVLTALGVTVLT